jgi:hypothetical protein
MSGRPPSVRGSEDHPIVLSAVPEHLSGVPNRLLDLSCTHSHSCMIEIGVIPFDPIEDQAVASHCVAIHRFTQHIAHDSCDMVAETADSSRSGTERVAQPPQRNIPRCMGS